MCATIHVQRQSFGTLLSRNGIIVAGVLLAAANTLASDWPSWHGEKQDSISTETNLNWDWGTNVPKVIWKAQAGKGFSSFAVSNGKVITLGNDKETDTIFCWEAATGKELWKHAYACPLAALAHEGGPYATPVIDNHHVYSLSKAGHYFCLNLETGKPLWSGAFPPPLTNKVDYKVWWGFAGSPVVMQDKVVFSVGSACVALDKNTGVKLWDNGPGRPGYSTPVEFGYHGKKCFAFLGGHEVIGVETEKGNVLWRVPWRTEWDQNAPDVIVSSNQMFVCSGHNVGCALFDLGSESPKEIWRNKNLICELSTPVLWNGNLYGYSQSHLTCVSWSSGERKWTVDDSNKGSLILVGDKLVALEEDGLLRIVQAVDSGYKPVAQAKILDGRCWTQPVVANGLLYARNAAGEVVCLDLRPAAVK